MPTDSAVWHTVPLRDIGLLRARYVRQAFPRHFHETFVVCVDEQGAHGSWYRGASVVIPARTVTVVPPGEVHTGQRVPGCPWHYRAMYPSADLLAELARDVGLRGTGVPSFPSLCLSDVDLADTLIRAHRQCEDDPDPVAAEGSVVEVLSTLLRRHALGPGARSEDGAPIRATQRVVEYLHECFADRITLGGVAQTVGLSRYAVLRVFRRDVGIPPYGFLTQIRVEQAKNLLRTGQSLAAVAQMVGFADQSHLTRHFRRLVGVTPGAFARAVRAA